MVISADLPYGGPSFPERYKAWRNRQLEAGNKAIDDFGTWLMRELGLKATPSVEGSPVVDPRDEPGFGRTHPTPPFVTRDPLHPNAPPPASAPYIPLTRGTGPSVIPRPPAIPQEIPPSIDAILEAITSKYRAPFSDGTWKGYNEDKYPPPMVGPVDPEPVSPDLDLYNRGYPGFHNPPFDPASPIPTPPVSVRAQPRPPIPAPAPVPGASIEPTTWPMPDPRQVISAAAAPAPGPVPQGSNEPARQAINDPVALANEIRRAMAEQGQAQSLPTVNVPMGGYGLNPQGSNAYGAGMSGNNVAEYFRLKAMGLVP